MATAAVLSFLYFRTGCQSRPDPMLHVTAGRAAVVLHIPGGRGSQMPVQLLIWRDVSRMRMLAAFGVDWSRRRATCAFDYDTNDAANYREHALEW